MPNAVITNYCNRRCPYCFAQHTMPRSGRAHMPLEDVVGIADLAAAGQQRVGVLGGEPATHPHFLEICQYLALRKLNVVVFSNGLLVEKIAAVAAAIPAESLTFAINVNYPEITAPAEAARQRATLAALGSRGSISLNMYRVDLDPCFAAELGAECRTSGILRVGLAQPIVDADNEYLATDHYVRAAAQLVRLARACFERGGQLSFDCGVPMCMFSDAQLDSMRRWGADLKFLCGPAVDIGIGREAWPCFPMAHAYRVTLGHGASLAEAHDEFMRQWEALRHTYGCAGLFADCADCAHRAAGLCMGGCLAHALRLAPGGLPRAPVSPPRAGRKPRARR
jgi:hypothetical protein